MKKWLIIVLMLINAMQIFAAVHVVRVSSNSINPKEVNVQTGDTVRFVWESGTHILNGSHPGFSPIQLTAQLPTRDIVFLNAGIYNYASNSIPNIAAKVVVAGNLLGRTNPIKTNNLLVFPNPTSKTLTIKHDFQKVDAIRIVDVLGKEHKLIQNGSQTTNKELEIDLGQLPKGIYFVTLHADGFQLGTKRFIKNAD